MREYRLTRPTNPDATAIAAWGRPAFDRMCAWIGVHASAALGCTKLIEIRALEDDMFDYPFFCPVSDKLYQCDAAACGERVELPGVLCGLAITIRALAIDEEIDHTDKGEAHSELLDAARQYVGTRYPQHYVAFERAIEWGGIGIDWAKVAKRIYGAAR